MVSDQQKILALLRAVGAVAWSTADNRRTHLPPGFADIVFCHPKLRAPACWEVKAPREKVTEAQVQFENDWCVGHGLYGRGDYEAAYNWLQRKGLIR